MNMMQDIDYSTQPYSWDLVYDQMASGLMAFRPVMLHK